VGTVTIRSILSAAALGVLLFGCTTEKVSLETGPREYVASDYPQILKRWTVTESVLQLSELDDKLTVTATFEAWDFRWAYVIKYAQDYRLTVEQRRELLEQTLRESQEWHEFYVALYGNNRRFTDLTKPNSAWIVRLIDDHGNETAPSKLTKIEKPTPLETRYYPYTSVWRHVFRIRFPRTTGDGRETIPATAGWFGLRFAGAEGNTELKWMLSKGTTPAVTTQRDRGAADK
jgi:hypothetical protein